jgi:hypothetical protein
MASQPAPLASKVRETPHPLQIRAVRLTDSLCQRLFCGMHHEMFIEEEGATLLGFWMCQHILLVLNQLDNLCSVLLYSSHGTATFL